MPKAEQADVEHVLQQLHDLGLTHLRARKRASLLTVESGPEDDPIAHFRLRRLDARTWGLEFPARGTKWERTPFADVLSELVNTVVSNFGWMVQPLT